MDKNISMRQNLSAMQESYINGLHQLTNSTRKKTDDPAYVQSDRLHSALPQRNNIDHAAFSRRVFLPQAPHISRKALIASLFFWILLMYGAYSVSQYISLFCHLYFTEADLEGAMDLSKKDSDLCISDVCTNDVCTSDVCICDVCTSDVCTSDVCTSEDPNESCLFMAVPTDTVGSKTSKPSPLVKHHILAIEEICAEKFKIDLKDNINVLNKYPMGGAGHYISMFPSNFYSIKDYPIQSSDIPPLVTGVDSSDVYRLENLLKHIQQLKLHTTAIKLIVFDLGLSDEEITKVTADKIDFELRQIPYEVFPPHLSDHRNFAWRPICIQEVLDDYGAAVYIDVGARFKSVNSLNVLRSRGGHHFLLWGMPVFTSLIAYTDKATFQFLNESRCAFSGANMLDTQMMVFYKTNVTWNEIMKPWLKCAFNLDCIAPNRSRANGCLKYRHPKPTGCHRYDVSALTIILNRRQQLTVGPTAYRSSPPRLAYPVERRRSSNYLGASLYVIFTLLVLVSLVLLVLRRKLYKLASLIHTLYEVRL